MCAREGSTAPAQIPPQEDTSSHSVNTTTHAVSWSSPKVLVIARSWRRPDIREFFSEIWGGDRMGNIRANIGGLGGIRAAQDLFEIMRDSIGPGRCTHTDHFYEVIVMHSERSLAHDPE